VLLVSFNAHTRAGDQECFIPRATMAIAPGEKAAHKRLNPTATNVPRLSLVEAVTAAAAAVSRASFRFPSLVAHLGVRPIWISLDIVGYLWILLDMKGYERI
jgi:hypothetical protein